jgi:hypothetical protein
MNSPYRVQRRVLSEKSISNKTDDNREELLTNEVIVIA